MAKKGFSLIELAVSVLIIGFLIAGVTAGRSMVRSAKINRVATEYQSFLSSINAFKATYDAYPGDMSNAYTLWGASCAASAAACNGSGDGIIYTISTSGRQEYYMAWKHMNLAGTLPGNYTGESLIANSAATIGVNIPPSQYGEKSGWWMGLTDVSYATSEDALLTARHAFMIGTARPDSFIEYPLFGPVDASVLDLKFDDGKPYTGRVNGLNGDNPPTNYNCKVGSGSSATYNIALDASKECWIWFQFE